MLPIGSAGLFLLPHTLQQRYESLMLQLLAVLSVLMLLAQVSGSVDTSAKEGQCVHFSSSTYMYSS